MGRGAIDLWKYLLVEITKEMWEYKSVTEITDSLQVVAGILR